MPVFIKPFAMHSIAKTRGDSLLEVVLALWLFGTAACAIVHFHLNITHSAHALQWQAQAIHLLEATAQAIESGADMASIQIRTNKRAAALLPNGRVFIKAMPSAALQHTYLTEGPFLVEVCWDTSTLRAASQQTSALKKTAIHSLWGNKQKIYVTVMRSLQS